MGDYGEIDKKSGEFEKEGNIYDEDGTAGVAAGHPPLTAPRDHVFEISSQNVKRVEFGLEPTVCVTLTDHSILDCLLIFTLRSHSEIPGIAEASAKGQWKFAKKRGALLVMHQPRNDYIPPKVLLKKLIKVPDLKNKYLVTETFTCPAYSLYLSSGGKHRNESWGGSSNTWVCRRR